MKRWGVLLGGLFAALAAHAELRLLTWNVGGNGLTNWTTDMPQVQAVGRILAHLEPDIVALQEIPNENGAYTRLGEFTRAYLPDHTNVYSPGTDFVLRSAILSRFPIRRIQSHLDGVPLLSFGSPGRFTRDLFEAEIDVPSLATPLHVFTTHLKAGGDATSIATRAAEAAAISNFFTQTFPGLYAGRPFVLMGDLNEDGSRPRNPALNPLPRLANAATTLSLLNATNPATTRVETWSSRLGLSLRFDYILTSAALTTNVTGALNFRSDRANPLPEPLLREDSATASDHLPVMAILEEPPPILFAITGIVANGGQVTLTWEADSGAGYRVERSADLKSWLQASATRATNSATLPPGSVTEFYRVVRIP